MVTPCETRMPMAATLRSWPPAVDRDPDPGAALDPGRLDAEVGAREDQRLLDAAGRSATTSTGSGSGTIG